MATAENFREDLQEVLYESKGQKFKITQIKSLTDLDEAIRLRCKSFAENNNMYK